MFCDDCTERTASLGLKVYQRTYADGRKSTAWYVSWYVGTKQFKKRIGTNKRAAELFAKDLELKRVRGELLGIKEEKRILFPALADEYLAWARGRKAPHTVEDEASAIGRCKQAFTGIAGKITTSEIEAFFTTRLKTVGPARHNRDLSLLKVLFKKAVEWGYARANPAVPIKKLREPPGRIRFLTDEERDRLLNACPDRLRTIVLLALNTGLRKSELLHLRWQDIDLQHRLLHVERSKNGERRDLPMTQTVLDLLRAMPRRVDTPYLFANDEGKPQESLKTTWKTAVTKAAVDDFTFHDLRHTFASTLIMHGVDIRTVQILLGHKTITMTVRYSHLSPNHLRAAVEVLDRTSDGAIAAD